MTELLGVLERATVGELLKIRYGKALPNEARNQNGKYPVVGSAGEMARTDHSLFDGHAVVIGRKGNVGQTHLLENGGWPTDTTYYAIVTQTFEPRFLAHQLVSLELSRLDSSTATPSLRRQDLEAEEIWCPSSVKQRRIVEVLEDYLSRLDAAESALRTNVTRLRVLHKSILTEMIPDISAYPSEWTRATVEEAGKVGLGRQRHPDWHSGSNMQPYLRVANVFEDRIDLSDIMQMHWPDESFERFKLKAGDVLLNEGQSPEFLGRPALYHGEPADTAFTNTLLRFQAFDHVLPEFALLVFRRHMHAGRFAKESRITTNIAHLSASRLKAIEFPIPSLAEQARLVRCAEDRLGAASRLGVQVARLVKRNQALRRALLSAAFSGRLTGHASHTEGDRVAGVSVVP